MARIIALSNGSGELQSCDRQRDQQSKKFFHGDSSFFVLASLPLRAGLGRILPVWTSLVSLRIIASVDAHLESVAQNAITSIGLAVARNATGFA